VRRSGFLGALAALIVAPKAIGAILAAPAPKAVVSEDWLSVSNAWDFSVGEHVTLTGVGGARHGVVTAKSRGPRFGNGIRVLWHP
jgi:hypothetical protein